MAFVSFPEPWGIGVEVATKMPCEQQRLQVRHEPERRNFVEKRMLALRPLAFLPSGKHRLSAFVGQENGPIVLGHEILHALTSRRGTDVRTGRPCPPKGGRTFSRCARDRAERPAPPRAKISYFRISSFLCSRDDPSLPSRTNHHRDPPGP